MRSAALVGLAALLIGVSAASPQQPSKPAVPVKLGTAPVVGLVWRASGNRIARLNPATLRPLAGRTLPAPEGLVVFSPDRSRLALANRNGSIDLVAPARMKQVRHLLSRGELEGLAWVPGSLIAIQTQLGRAVVLDPVADRVRRIQSLDGSFEASQTSRDGLVVALSPRDGIGPTRLTVIRATGSGGVVLDRIPSGASWPPADSSGHPPIGTVHGVGLAVDSAGNRAFVVDPAGLVAEVDLATMAVTYHELSHPVSLLGRLHGWLEPRAAAKGVNGPSRGALYLPGGLIAVAGSNNTATLDAAGNEHYSTAPSGLQLIDTHNWSVRSIDASVSTVGAGDGLLLAAGTTWDDRTHGRGLDVRAADGSLLFHALGSQPVYGAGVRGGRAYAFLPDGVVVIELGSGAVVRSVRGAHPPQLILP